MNATNHPNPKLHDLLANAAKEHKLDAALIKEITGSAALPTVERDASAYVNWNTTLSLLGRAPAKAWFAGVAQSPCRCSYTKLTRNTYWNLILPVVDNDDIISQRIVTNLW